MEKSRLLLDAEIVGRDKEGYQIEASLTIEHMQNQEVLGILADAVNKFILQHYSDMAVGKLTFLALLTDND